MPVQGLGVEETALPIAAAKRRGGRPGVLGVSTASTSTVVPLGRLRRAAGAHLARRSQRGRGCPVLPRLPRRAAPRGCRNGLPRARVTGGSATRLPRTCANLWREEKLGPERQLVTNI